MDISKYYNVDTEFIDELFLLQSELVKLQKHISENQIRLAIIFEGRDAAGKGAAIARFTQFLNPQFYRVVALGKPSKKERKQWYFQRYLKRIPSGGEMVFFDRSWYNRAVVEPAMGFCTEAQYQLYMNQVNKVESLLIEDGIILIKFWFSIDSLSQQARIQQRLDSPLQRWKVSPVDLAAKEKWEEFTFYKKEMFERTSSKSSPWIIVQGEKREQMRIESMRYILSLFDYEDKSKDIQLPTTEIVHRY